MNSGEPMYFHKECGIKPIKGKMTQGIVHRQSDYSIVSKKSRNWDGEKGVAGMQRGVRDTISIHGDGTRLSTKLTSLTKRAEGNPKYKFTSVTKPLITEGFLKECFWELKRNKTPGIDGVTLYVLALGSVPEEPCEGKLQARFCEGLSKVIGVINFMRPT